MFGLGERASAAALCCDQTLGGAMHKSTVIGTRARMDPVDTGLLISRPSRCDIAGFSRGFPSPIDE
jgi:hypothetical protein